jgi:hypothetical protein
MKFLAILSFLSISALAAAVAEPEAYADAEAAANVLEKRDCNRRVPLCAGGTFIEKTGCQCSGQVERCDLWACPRGRRVGVHSMCLRSSEPPVLLATASDLLNFTGLVADFRNSKSVARDAAAACSFKRRHFRNLP